MQSSQFCFRLTAPTKVLLPVNSRDPSHPVSHFRVQSVTAFLLWKMIETWTYFLFLASLWTQYKKCPEFIQFPSIISFWYFHFTHPALLSPKVHLCTPSHLALSWVQKEWGFYSWEGGMEILQHGRGGLRIRISNIFQIAIFNFVLKISKKCSGIQKWESGLKWLILFGDEATQAPAQQRESIGFAIGQRQSTLVAHLCTDHSLPEGRDLKKNHRGAQKFMGRGQPSAGTDITLQTVIHFSIVTSII